MLSQEKIIQTALAYAGCPKPDTILHSRAVCLYEKAMQLVQFIVVQKSSRIRPAEKGADLIDLNLFLPGSLAANILKGCCEAIVLGATLGIGFDRELMRLQMISMSDAILFDAIGSALIDALLDDWQEAALQESEYPYGTDRFSCGYGDLPLTLQQEIASALSLERYAGIHVSQSQMMTPSKSVTAIFGLSKTPKPARIRGCAYCSMNQTCSIRKGGNTCVQT